MTAILFFFALAVLAYAYLGFPILLLARSRLVRRPHRSGDHEPTVSLIICAHNEVSSIGEKLENIRQLDYPSDRLEVIVASDGSTDGTDDLVRSRSDSGVRLLSLPRLGKIPTLNAAVAEARGEILVFSDANSMYERSAVRALVRPFVDSRVGGVAGDQRYAKAASVVDEGEGERAYWNIDRKLKQWQSVSGSVTSSTGAIHAVRRSLFRVVPSGVTDDFWISTNVVAQGTRLVFAGDAIAIEPAASSSGLEFDRKVRVMTRGLRGVWLMRELLDPFRHGFYSVQLLSHKVLRRLVFVPLAVLAVTAPLLWADGMIFRLATLGQSALYGAAALGGLIPSRGRVSRIASIPFFFCMVNAAAAVATANLLRGKTIESWEPRREAAASRAADGVSGEQRA
jgi:cellulose synthase/poly-beta-1,6-N-acetylglucosamine synthase-like glycosyltransferase